MNDKFLADALSFCLIVKAMAFSVVMFSKKDTEELKHITFVYDISNLFILGFCFVYAVHKIAY